MNHIYMNTYIHEVRWMAFQFKFETFSFDCFIWRNTQVCLNCQPFVDWKTTSSVKKIRKYNDSRRQSVKNVRQVFAFARHDIANTCKSYTYMSRWLKFVIFKYLCLNYLNNLMKYNSMLVSQICMYENITIVNSKPQMLLYGKCAECNCMKWQVIINTTFSNIKLFYTTAQLHCS